MRDGYLVDCVSRGNYVLSLAQTARGRSVLRSALGNFEEAGVWFTSAGAVWKCPEGTVRDGSKPLCRSGRSLWTLNPGLPVAPIYVGEPADGSDESGGGSGLLVPILIGAAILGGLFFLGR